MGACFSGGGGGLKTEIFRQTFKSTHFLSLEHIGKDTRIPLYCSERVFIILCQRECLKLKISFKPLHQGLKIDFKLTHYII